MVVSFKQTTKSYFAHEISTKLFYHLNESRLCITLVYGLEYNGNTVPLQYASKLLSPCADFPATNNPHHAEGLVNPKVRALKKGY
jgi:hypothetical protein